MRRSGLNRRHPGYDQVDRRDSKVKRLIFIDSDDIGTAQQRLVDIGQLGAHALTIDRGQHDNARAVPTSSNPWGMGLGHRVNQKEKRKRMGTSRINCRCITQSTGQLNTGLNDTTFRQVEFIEQLFALTMLDEQVGQAQSFDMARVPAFVIGQFQYGRTKAAHQLRFFERQDKATFMENFMQQSSIQWLDKPRIDHGHFDAILGLFVGGTQGGFEHGTQRQDRAVGSPTHNLAFAQLDLVRFQTQLGR